MKRALMFLLVAALLAPIASFAVEPKYVGEYGNAEEPALRPYKWMWRGVKALFYQTGHSFAHGNMKTPVLGTAEVARGLRKGTLELGESTYHGLAFAPVPPKDSYKHTMRLNEMVDNEKARSNFSDFVFSPLTFPVLKFVDCYPAENESRVQIREERSKAWRERHREEVRAKQAEPSDAKKAKDGRGNLLRLAK